MESCKHSLEIHAQVYVKINDTWKKSTFFKHCVTCGMLLFAESRKEAFSHPSILRRTEIIRDDRH